LRLASTKIKTNVNSSMYELYQKISINMMPTVKLSLL